eukprot:TRINITY_DN6285_c0_g1_i2.p1 TRINITY_DN6285_c0_g1~~TRINITY_DN6285_c0_g1_i2.p1  ORF type:complete len:1759 (+),score=451.20 TRINITY_DN6285_c0_g1_i2:385-5661(+)
MGLRYAASIVILYIILGSSAQILPGSYVGNLTAIPSRICPIQNSISGPYSNDCFNQPTSTLGTCGYYDVNSCCSTSNVQQIENLLSEVADQYEGYPKCIQNFEYAFCGVNCAPYQGDFVSDTVTPGSGNGTSVITNTISICASFCDEWYQSCGAAMIGALPVNVMYPTSTSFCTAQSPVDNYQIVVVANGDCFNGPFLPSNPTDAYAYGPGTVFAIAGVQANFTIQSVDVYGNRVLLGGDVFTVTLTSGSQSVTGTVVDNQDGSYSASYVATVAGSYVLTITTGGNQIRNSPLNVTVYAGTPGASSVITGWSGTFVAGTVVNFNITSLDRYGNVAYSVGAQYSVQITGPSTNIYANISSRGDGTYAGSYQLFIAGTYQLTAALNGAQFAQAQTVIVAGPSDPTQTSAVIGDCGDASQPKTFYVYTLDRYGNNRTSGGDSISVTFASTIPGINITSSLLPVFTVTDLNNGTYAVTYRTAFTGGLIINVRINNTSIYGQPVTLQCYGGPGCPNGCSGRGLCLLTGVCLCGSNYTGANCSSSAQPGPTLARFDDNPSTAVQIFFNAPTDRGQQSGEFPCSRLIVGVATFGNGSFCVWYTSSVLSIYVGCNSTVRPGDTVLLRGGVIRSADGTSVTIAQTPLIIQPPINPPTPYVVIDGPTYPSTCTNLTFYGNRDTYGLGGKPGAYKWSIVTDHSTPVLSNRFASANSGSITLLSNEVQTYLDSGRDYNISLAVTNTYGVTGTRTLPMLVGQLAIPTVVVTPTNIRVSRADQVKLRATAYRFPSDCGGFNQEALIYSWIRTSGTPFPIDYNSGNSQSFFIAPNSLLPGNYTFECRVAFAQHPTLFGVGRAYIEVVMRSLIAEIAGGDQRQFQLGRTANLTLDGSASYDPDAAPGNLTYTWTCLNNILPFQPCYGSEYNQTGPILSIPSTSLTIGEYTFTLTVSKPGRAPVSTSVVITTNGVGPDVTITAPDEINANQELVLVGGAIAGNVGAIAWRWYVVDGDVSLANYENCGITYPANSTFENCRNQQNLIVRANSLAPGSLYRFRLLANTSLGVGYAEKLVYVNDRPTGGCCQLLPPVGTAAYTTLYRLLCSGWEDINQPLSYAFTRTSVTPNAAAGATVPLVVGYSPTGYLEFLLPPGNITIFISISDSLGATTLQTLNVVTRLSTALLVLTPQQRINELSGTGTLNLPYTLASAQFDGNQDLTFQITQFILDELASASNNQFKRDVIDKFASKRQDTSAQDVRERMVESILTQLSSEVTPETVGSKLFLLAAATSVSSEVSPRTIELILTALPAISSSLLNQGVTGLGQSSMVSLLSNILQSQNSTSDDATGIVRTGTVSLEIGLLKQQAAGQLPVTINSNLLLTSIQRNYLDVFPSSIQLEGHSLSLSKEVINYLTSTLDLAEVGTSLALFRENIYSYGTSFTLSSYVFGVDLWQPGTLQYLDLQNLPGNVTIVIPIRLAADFTLYEPQCLFWNEQTEMWASDGCQAVAYNADNTTCVCTHLTDFGVRFVPRGPFMAPNGAVPLPLAPQIPNLVKQPWISLSSGLVIIFVIVLAMALLAILFFLRKRGDAKIREDQILLGYGNAVNEEELENFDDLASKHTREEEMRQYSIRDLESLDDTDTDFTFEDDYSLGLIDENVDEPDPVVLMEMDEDEEMENRGFPRLSRRQLGDDAKKAYGSTSTHRESFQAEYDLEAPRNPQSTKPQTSTRSARERDQSANTGSEGPLRYAPQSTRITSTPGRDSNSSRTSMLRKTDA